MNKRLSPEDKQAREAILDMISPYEKVFPSLTLKQFKTMITKRYTRAKGAAVLGMLLSDDQLEEARKKVIQ